MSQRAFHDGEATEQLRRAKAHEEVGDLARALFYLGAAWANDVASLAGNTDRNGEILTLAEAWADRANGATPREESR